MNQEQNNVVPNTPNEAVLPQDKALNVTASIPTQLEAVPQTQTINQVPLQPQMVTPPVGETQTQVVSPPPANPIAQGIQNGTLLNQVDQGVGIKEGNQALPPEKKKKGGKFFLIFILLVLIIGGIFAGIIYYTQYYTSEKRLYTILDGVFSFTNNINNDTFEKKSGSYTLDGSVDFNDKSYKVELEGKYAYDLTQSFDATINIKNLDVGTKLFDETLSTEIYLYDGNAYLLLQNFYDKYIFTSFPPFKTLSDYINQNSIDYVKTKNALVGITKDSIRAMGYSTKLESVDGGFKNIITIPINEHTRKQFIEKFNEGIINNEELKGHITSALDLTDKELERLLARNLDNVSTDTGTISFTTSLFDKKLHLININQTSGEDKTNITIKPISNGYEIKEVKNSKTILDLTYTNIVKKTTSTTEKTINIKGTTLSSITNSIPNIENVSKSNDDVAISFDINFVNIEDVAPKVEKINLREAIRMDNIPREDLIIIIEKVKQFGRLQEILNNIGINLDSLVPPEAPSEVVVDETQVVVTE